MFTQPAPENTFEEDNQVIRETLDAIGRKYVVKKATEAEEAEIQEKLSRFDAFNEFQQVFLYGAARIAYNDQDACFAVVSLNAQSEGLTAYQGQQSGMTELAYVGLATLNKDLGQVDIRPETTTESIIEIFHPTKVKFDADPEFSKKYRAMADDAQRVKNQVTGRFLETIKQFDGLNIEIRGRDLLVRLPKGLSVEVGQKLADFLVGIKDEGEQTSNFEP